MEAINLFLETYKTAGTIEAIEVPLLQKLILTLLEKTRKIKQRSYPDLL